MDCNRSGSGRFGVGRRLSLLAVAVLSLSLGGCSSGTGEEDPIVLEVQDTESPDPSADAGSDTSDGADTGGQSCKDEYPVSQGATEPCCPEWGVDACGANLFCAAFDGRTQPTCYGIRSRQAGQSCHEDRHCNSESCIDGTCAYAKEQPCDGEIPCEAGTACEDGFSGKRCKPIGQGELGSVCASDDDCAGDRTCCADGERCDRNNCQADECRPGEGECPDGFECRRVSREDEPNIHVCKVSVGDSGECVNNEQCSGDKLCSHDKKCVSQCQSDSDCSADLQCRCSPGKRACHDEQTLCVKETVAYQCAQATEAFSDCCRRERNKQGPFRPEFDYNQCKFLASGNEACDTQDLKCLTKIANACGNQTPGCTIDSECRFSNVSPKDPC